MLSESTSIVWAGLSVYGMILARRRSPILPTARDAAGPCSFAAGLGCDGQPLPLTTEGDQPARPARAREPDEGISVAVKSQSEESYMRRAGRSVV